MLTKEEKEEFESLKIGFNFFKEEDSYDVKVSKKVEIARVFSKKLLTISLYLNICALCCYFLALGFTFLKPSPDIYASTPDGKIYLLQKINIKKVK